MAQLQIVYLLRPGTQEQWRRLYQEVAESRREEFEASCRHMGITQVQVRLVQMLHGDLMLITLHTQESHQTLQKLARDENRKLVQIAEMIVPRRWCSGRWKIHFFGIRA